MGSFTGKMDTDDGNTHHVFERSDGTYDVHANDSIAKSWGTLEASRCGSLKEAAIVVAARTGSSVIRIR